MLRSRLGADRGFAGVREADVVIKRFSVHSNPGLHRRLTITWPCFTYVETSKGYNYSDLRIFLEGREKYA
jgi:hypothetical protein